MKVLIVICIYILLMASGCSNQAPKPNTESITPMAIISIDINPSLELSIGSDNIVLAVDTLNTEASDIVSDDMIGGTMDSVLEQILTNADKAGYLKSDDTVLIGYTELDEEVSETSEKPPKGKPEEQLIKFLEKKQEQYEFLFAKGNADDHRASKSSGLSLGKYTMLKFLDGVSMEDIKEMRMAEISERKELRDTEKAETHAFKFIGGRGNSEDKRKDNDNKNKNNKNGKGNNSSETEENND